MADNSGGRELKAICGAGKMNLRIMRRSARMDSIPMLVACVIRQSAGQMEFLRGARELKPMASKQNVARTRVGVGFRKVRAKIHNIMGHDCQALE
jgi:hypothetical protein